jgi:NTE family protein
MHPPEPPPDSTPGLALSLESSFFGFYAHAGFAAGLLESGIRPQFFSGASAGSMISVFLAAGFSTREIRDIIFSRKFKWAFWELKSFARGFAMMLYWPGVAGLTSFRHAEKYFSGLLKDRAPNLEDCRHGEVSIPVANLKLLRTEILSQGNSAAAILASCAVPCLVSPQKLPSGYCWDGGIANSSPFLHYAEDPRVITIITHHIRHQGADDPWDSNDFKPRISDTLARGHHLIAREIHRLHLNEMRHSSKRMIPATTIADRPGLFSSVKTQVRCYDAGYEQAMRIREKIKEDK